MYVIDKSCVKNIQTISQDLEALNFLVQCLEDVKRVIILLNKEDLTVKNESQMKQLIYAELKNYTNMTIKSCSALSGYGCFDALLNVIGMPSKNFYQKINSK